MNVVGIVLTAFCGLTALMSAVGKLTGQEQAVGILDHVRVTGTLRQALPFLQLAGGIGALVGLFMLPALGVAALVGLALYFFGAVAFHVRIGDRLPEFGIPLGLALVMTATAIIRAVTI